MEAQFIVTFRGVEVGRYPTAELAVGAAQSVIDTELGAHPDPSTGPPTDLPQIFWQPPPMYFPFDASAYWRQQAARDVPQYAPPLMGNQQFLGAPPDPTPPPGPAPVYGGPPVPSAER